MKRDWLPPQVWLWLFSQRLLSNSSKSPKYFWIVYVWFLNNDVFTMFVIVLAAAEAAVALAIIINLFKNRGSVNVDEAKELRG